MHSMSFELRLGVGERQPVGLQVQCRHCWQRRRPLLVVRAGQVQELQRARGMQRLCARKVFARCRRFVGGLVCTLRSRKIWSGWDSKLCAVSNACVIPNRLDVFGRLPMRARLHRVARFVYWLCPREVQGGHGRHRMHALPARPLFAAKLDQVIRLLCGAESGVCARNGWQHISISNLRGGQGWHA